MTILHTHPEQYPESRMETLQSIHRTCVLTIQANQAEARSILPRPSPIGIRY